MRTHSKLLVVGFTAALLLAFGVASASANSLEVNRQSFKIDWEPLTLESTAGVAAIRCPVILEGTFHETTFAKVTGALVGNVTAGTVLEEECEGGSAFIKQESLPWHVVYRGFSGELPDNITGVALGLVGAEFTITRPVSCTTHTTESQPGVGIANVSSGTITGLTAEEEDVIPLEGEFLCLFAGEGSFEGTGIVTDGNGEELTVTLIDPI